MKTRHLILTVVALLAFAGNAKAQRDITSQYITNATLSNGTTGWTVKNFNTPVRGNNTVGYASEAYAGWNGLDINNYSLTQSITLPAGSYRLVNYSFFRQGLAYNTDDSKSLAYLKAGSQQVAIKTLGSITAAGYANSQAEGANCFDSKMYRNVLEFTLDAQTTLEIGVVGTFDLKQSWIICGMFELFDMDDLASVSSPTDMTYAITNPGFEYRDLSGWTNNGFAYMDNNNWNTHTGIGWVEKYGGSGAANATLTQTIDGLENGLYEVILNGHLQQGAGTSGFYLYANSDRVAIGSTTQDYSVRTTVTNGSLTIKIATESCTGNWAAFDKVRMKYYGDPLDAYRDILADKVAEAQDLVNGGTLRTGASSQLQTIINDNDNDNDAFTTETEFSTAVANIEAGMSQANAIAATYASFDSYKDKVETLKTGVETGTPLTKFETAVSAATTAMAAATTTTVAATQIAALHAAAMTFISTAEAPEGGFDLMYLASQNHSDWKKKDGSAAGIVADQFLTNRPASVPSFAESYETTCATTGNMLYQTITDLPAGYYHISLYAQALYTSGRGFASDAIEGDADRSFAFANDLEQGLPIKFGTSADYSELTPLDVNVHLSEAGSLTYGVKKKLNGSNWHFAQIMGLTYSKDPDLTPLEATRDNLVTEAQGILDGVKGDYLTAAQRQALQDAITAGNAADDYAGLTTATMTTLPNAINTANQQYTQAKAGQTSLRTALERFERDYNLVDGTDYRRLTMSAQAWTDLLADVNAVTTALDDLSQASQYATLAQALNDQMDATDASIRLFKSYQAMLDGVAEQKDNSDASALATAYTNNSASANMDTDAAEQTAITALNDAFVAWAATQDGKFTVNGFLGGNLDFSEAEIGRLGTVGEIYDMEGWEEAYSNVTVATDYLRNQNSSKQSQLYIRSNWGSVATNLKASKLKMLPVGKYRLKLNWSSTMANMTNQSAYVIDGTSTAIGATTAADTYTPLTMEFEIEDNAKPFDLIFGLIKQNTGNTPAQILVDDIELYYLVESQFQLALEAARDALAGASSGTAAYYGLNSAINDYLAYEGKEEDFADDAARTSATNVLKNAKIIADNGGNATSFVQNADFSDATLTNGVPNGWTAAQQATATGGDKWIRTQDGAQVFNYWENPMKDWEFNQTISDLPKGVYRFSIDMGTEGFTEGDAATQVAFIIGDATGASQQVNTLNNGNSRAFGTYTCAGENLLDNSILIGVRSQNYYLQCKNVRLDYLGDPATAANQAETDASYLRQDYTWWGRNALEYDATRTDWANAKNVVVFPSQKNQLIRAAANDQFANTTNKIVNGTCANLVLTDGSPVQNSAEFTATSASYSRNVTNVTSEFGTLLLPYPVQSTTDRKYYVLASLEGSPSDPSGVMHFESVDVLPAGTPALLHHTENGTMTFGASNVTVATTATNSSQPLTGWTFQGNYGTAQVINATAENAPDYYYVSGNKFYHATGTLTVNPFRTYFIYTGGGEVAERFDIALDGEETTGVKALEKAAAADLLLLTDKGSMIIAAQTDQTFQVVSMSGAVVASGRLKAGETKSLNMPAGVYLVNGKKVYIK